MKLNKYQTLIVKTGGFFLIWLLLSTSLNLMHVGLGLLASFAVAWLNTDRAVSRFMIVQLRFVRYLYLAGWPNPLQWLPSFRYDPPSVSSH